MKRICKYCGKEYDGNPGSSACPECAEQLKKSVVRTRVCRQCGREFPGGPRAWYCPDCRLERRREADRKQKRVGTQRPLGSIDKCAVCGKDYAVKSARQRYCPNCAEEAVRKADREQAAAWNHENNHPDRRREQRKASAAQIECVICGRAFVPTSAAITCSTECSRELSRRNASEYEKRNRAGRNRYHRERVTEKEANMSPEEYQAYRDAVNAKARENYRKRRNFKMDEQQIVASARILAKLESVLGKLNGAEIANASVFPVKAMLQYNREAFDKGMLTEEVQDYLTEQYAGFSLETVDANKDKRLDEKGQKIWKAAYAEAAAKEGLDV